MTPLDKFGRWVVTRLRDRQIEQYEMLSAGSLRTPGVIPLQDALMALPPQERVIVRRCVITVLDCALHDLLAGLQESHDLNIGIEVLVDGENVAELSGMLHGQLYGPVADTDTGDEGWVARFSKYQFDPENP